MSNSWKTIKELRETSIDISGGYYSEKYVDKYNLSEKWIAKYYVENPSMWVPEAVEVTIDSNLEILYRIKHVGSRHKKQKEKFKTSLGTFISHNQGEFGGELITPKETLHGNFEAVFECDGFVYAIDSCDHMCMGHIKIYTFSKNIDAIKLYESIDFLKDETIYESLSLEGLYVEEDRAYILSAGRIEQNYLGENKTYEEKSYLYEIKNGTIVNTIEFDFWFDNVENIIVNKNRLIIGMDKVVAIVGLDTKEIKAYTPISIEAEKDIIKTKTK